MKAIMVMFDSLNRHHLSPYGCDWVKTPNFDRLARRSVTFDNAWVGSMPCMPARRDMHTGRLGFLHRSWGPIEPFDDSVPEILKQNGVHTHLVTDPAGVWANVDWVAKIILGGWGVFLLFNLILWVRKLLFRLRDLDQ